MSDRQLRVFAVSGVALVTAVLTATSVAAQSAPKTGWEIRTCKGSGRRRGPRRWSGRTSIRVGSF